MRVYANGARSRQNRVPGMISRDRCLSQSKVEYVVKIHCTVVVSRAMPLLAKKIRFLNKFSSTTLVVFHAVSVLLVRAQVASKLYILHRVK